MNFLFAYLFIDIDLFYRKNNEDENFHWKFDNFKKILIIIGNVSNYDWIIHSILFLFITYSEQ